MESGSKGKSNIYKEHTSKKFRIKLVHLKFESASKSDTSNRKTVHGNYKIKRQLEDYIQHSFSLQRLLNRTSITLHR